LQRVFFHAAMQPVIIPARGDQNPFSIFGHPMGVTLPECAYFSISIAVW
jgi:hypothetical protein